MSSTVNRFGTSVLSQVASQPVTGTPAEEINAVLRDLSALQLGHARPHSQALQRPMAVGVASSAGQVPPLPATVGVTAAMAFAQRFAYLVPDMQAGGAVCQAQLQAFAALCGQPDAYLYVPEILVSSHFGDVAKSHAANILREKVTHRWPSLPPDDVPRVLRWIVDYISKQPMVGPHVARTLGDTLVAMLQRRPTDVPAVLTSLLFCQMPLTRRLPLLRALFELVVRGRPTAQSRCVEANVSRFYVDALKDKHLPEALQRVVIVDLTNMIPYAPTIFSLIPNLAPRLGEFLHVPALRSQAMECFAALGECNPGRARAVHYGLLPAVMGGIPQVLAELTAQAATTRGSAAGDTTSELVKAFVSMTDARPFLVGLAKFLTYILKHHERTWFMDDNAYNPRDARALLLQFSQIDLSLMGHAGIDDDAQRFVEEINDACYAYWQLLITWPAWCQVPDCVMSEYIATLAKMGEFMLRRLQRPVDFIAIGEIPQRAEGFFKTDVPVNLLRALARRDPRPYAVAVTAAVLRVTGMRQANTNPQETLQELECAIATVAALAPVLKTATAIASFIEVLGAWERFHPHYSARLHGCLMYVLSFAHIDNPRHFVPRTLAALQSEYPGLRAMGASAFRMLAKSIRAERTTNPAPCFAAWPADFDITHRTQREIFEVYRALSILADGHFLPADCEQALYLPQRILHTVFSKDANEAFSEAGLTLANQALMALRGLGRSAPSLMAMCDKLAELYAATSPRLAHLLRQDENVLSDAAAKQLRALQVCRHSIVDLFEVIIIGRPYTSDDPSFYAPCTDDGSASETRPDEESLASAPPTANDVISQGAMIRQRREAWMNVVLTADREADCYDVIIPKILSLHVAAEEHSDAVLLFWSWSLGYTANAESRQLTGAPVNDPAALFRFQSTVLTRRRHHIVRFGHYESWQNVYASLRYAINSRDDEVSASARHAIVCLVEDTNLLHAAVLPSALDTQVGHSLRRAVSFCMLMFFLELVLKAWLARGPRSTADGRVMAAFVLGKLSLMRRHPDSLLEEMPALMDQGRDAREQHTLLWEHLAGGLDPTASILLFNVAPDVSRDAREALYSILTRYHRDSSVSEWVLRIVEGELADVAPAMVAELTARWRARPCKTYDIVQDFEALVLQLAPDNRF